MKFQTLVRPAAAVLAVALATFASGGVWAQTRTAPITMTDTEPLPADDRASTGAIVLSNSLVRAQRDNAFANAAARTGVATVGRGVMRATMKAQTEADLALGRQSEALDLHGRGAGSLTEK